MKNNFSLIDLLSQNSADDIFIYSDTAQFSYSESIDEISRYTSFINNLNIRKTYAAILGRNNAEVIFLVFSLWLNGITPVMINTQLTPGEINGLISESGCSIIFCYSDIFPVKGFDIPVIKFPFGESVNLPKSISNIDYDETAVVIFTSGSTGKAKGVELTFKTLKDAALLQDKFLNQEPGDKWLASLPFYHISGFSIISRSIFLNSSLILMKTLNNDDLLDSIRKFRPDYISVVSTQLKYMLEENFNEAAGIKKILTGGGFTDTKLINDALNRNWKIARVYGSTETAAFIAAIDKNKLRKFPEASGKELVADSIFILDENKKITSGREGEVALKNIPLMKGYLNDSEGTLAKYYSDYYLTGDIGYINEEGFLFILMRRNDIVITGGENVNIREVEDVLKEIKNINDAVVFPESDLKWGQTVSAAVCCINKISEAEIIAHLKEKLASFKIPKRFYFVDKIPRNELGKIQVDSLKKALNIS